MMISNFTNKPVRVSIVVYDLHQTIQEEITRGKHSW